MCEYSKSATEIRTAFVDKASNEILVFECIRASRLIVKKFENDKHSGRPTCSKTD